MHWPWEFQDLTPEERHARRLVLDRYGHYGFLLSVSPAIIMLAVRFTMWAVAFFQVYASNYRLAPGDPGSAYPAPSPPATPATSTAPYDGIPDSPSLKSRRLTTRGSWEAWLRRVKWWLSDDVVVFGQSWGQRDEWVVGSAYFAVLLTFCAVETGRDYLHLTKRFGIVGMSQLPLQYILAMRHVSPLLSIFRTSHEQINRWHRALGAIVYILVTLHTILYLNFFAQTPSPSGGSFWGRLLRPVVALGLTAFFSMTVLSTTALGFVRRWSYRLFFITHVLVAFSLPAVVFFHASHAKYYVAAALLLLIADITLRKIHTVTTQARIEAIPGTQLVRLVAPIPHGKMGLFRQSPSSHVFLSLPHSSRPTTSFFSIGGYWLFEMLFNPFTIASVNEQANDVTLIVRARDGPMSTTLKRYAKPAGLPKETVFDGDNYDDEGDDDNEETPAISTVGREDPDSAASSGTPGLSGSVSVNLEGPYGTTAYFPTLTPQNYDRVLLVAGGVGATFIVPLYRSIVEEAAAASASSVSTSQGGAPAFSPMKVDLVWSVRGAGDATWAVVSGDSSERSLLQDKNVRIFLTGNNSSTSTGDVELSSLRRNTSNGFASSAQQRPDLRQIVDDAFRHGNEERVAVLVCGPEAMVQELRQAVAGWVQKGRIVWWHNESFGW
ncbi:metalloreductase fre8 [Ophiostoma piceae UAMH 11346]|uniref:Metalloreductase fre8 n=1 Tax=Ophiostoma piceae (strain UAMH 11346) TaxID=1262450 RepID=S3BPQ8_OPHP1|nr:metalloreductase fre8 [Ophiostoma piceae UAMH 11346]